MKYRSFFILRRSKRTWALQRVSLNDLTACKKKNQKAAPARPQLSMALADPAAGVTGFSRTDKLCLFKSCPVCLCVCVFHYNGPKHSPFLHCNWSITFWEAECMIFRVGGERESEGEVSSVLLFSAVLREIVSGCFHLLRSHGGKMISSEEVEYSEAGWLEGSKGQTCTADRSAFFSCGALNDQSKPHHARLHGLSADDTAPPPVGGRPGVRQRAKCAGSSGAKLHSLPSLQVNGVHSAS